MLAVSAEANTSAGAPSVICVTSADDASKLNVVVASGLAAVNALPISVKASVSEAAANTVISPATPEGAVVSVDPLSSPHAAASIEAATTETASRR